MVTTKKPRVRKVETVRERNQKASLKSDTGAGKSKKGTLQRAGSLAARPLKAAGKPLNIRPVRFVLKWISLILAPRYFRNAFKELRQVTWPSRRETWKLTFAVLIFATVFGFLVTITDFGLDKLIRRIVLR